MTPTQNQLDDLARLFTFGETGDEDDFADLMLDATDVGRSVVATRDAINQFDGQHWVEATGRVDHNGGVYYSGVQVAKGQPRVSLAVIDCGDFRLVLKR
jgi:hypothetical protein